MTKHITAETCPNCNHEKSGYDAKCIDCCVRFIKTSSGNIETKFETLAIHDKVPRAEIEARL